MAIKFRFTPKNNRKIEERNTLAWKFQGADKAGKARILLDAARTLRDGLGIPNERKSYNDSYLYRVIPEIARRLDPGIEILPEEVQADDEEHFPDRLVRNMSNEVLGLFAYQCHRFGDYRGIFDEVVNATRDIDALENPRIRAVSHALDLLTCHDVHGNYAIHAMLALDPEALQAGVKQLPGHYKGVDTALNVPRERDPDQGKPWCLVSARCGHDNLIAESEDHERIVELYDMHMRAWTDPVSWNDPDREPDARERELRGERSGMLTRFGCLPDEDRRPPVAIQIVHREAGLERGFFLEDLPTPALEDEGPQP